MEEKEKVAILFKRKQANKRKEYVVIPYDYVLGEENNNKFIVGEVSYKNVKDIDSINDSIVYGFAVSRNQILNMLINEGFFDEEDNLNNNADMEDLILDFLDEFLYNLKNYNFYQCLVNNDSILSTHMFKKYIKELETIDTRKLPKTILENDMEFAAPEEAVKETKEIAQPSKKETKLFMPATSTKSNFIDVKELYEIVTSFVIGQDAQVKKIISAIAQNQVITNPTSKLNLLVAGSTGVGKTEIFRIISRHLDLPLTIANATDYTISGYEGKSVEEMLVSLYRNAGNDEKRAERGILILDEVDKLAGRDSNERIATTGVQESLLKIIEGGVNTFKNQMIQISINTDFVTFVGLGAFSGMEKAVLKRKVGFGEETTSDVKDKFTTETFEKYGMVPEFVGRCNTRVIMNDLDKDQLKRILLESKNSQLRLKQELLATYGVELLYDDKITDAIARVALSKKTGARGLATVITEMLEEAIYDVQTNPNRYQTLQIFEETVEDNTKYILHEPVRKIKR